jgi:hypothetical protein
MCIKHSQGYLMDMIDAADVDIERDSNLSYLAKVPGYDRYEVNWRKIKTRCKAARKKMKRREMTRCGSVECFGCDTCVFALALG